VRNVPTERETVLLNPFCDAAKEMARKTPPLNSLGPKYIQACRARIEWFSTPSVDRDGIPLEGRKAPPPDLVEPADVQFDVAVLYLLLQSAAALFQPSSFEVRTLISLCQEITRRRAKAAYMKSGDSILDLIDDGVVRTAADELPRGDMYKVMALRKFASPRSGASSYSNMHEIRFKVDWTELLTTESELVDFYIRDGWAYLSPNDLVDLISQRTAHKMEDYVARVGKKMRDAGVKPHPVFERVAAMISEVARRSHEDMVAMGGKLQPECFPPCIRLAEEGVDAGSRNYAITVLLTSFLSHARISPLAGDAKISDFIDDMGIVTDEILPRIYEAGARCNPPLFEDQPLERANILYHLGFGLVENARLADSGNSTWYIPPNCEKIQREVPSLCNPDALCARIKNPIMYYVIKARQASEAAESADEA